MVVRFGTSIGGVMALETLGSSSWFGGEEDPSNLLMLIDRWEEMARLLTFI